MSLRTKCSKLLFFAFSTAMVGVGVFIPCAIADAQTTLLHSLAGGATDGASPQGGELIRAIDGNFYGTTMRGGTRDEGTVFRLAPAGTVSVLHSFNSLTEGSSPNRAGVLQATDGNFYGTTLFGGANQAGTIYRMTAGGALTVLHSFKFIAGGSPVDAAYPEAPLVQGNDGLLYGTASGGGAFGAGAVFLMTPGGFVAIMHSFDPTFEGSVPTSPLLQASDGNFYGTTSSQGIFGGGSVFRMTSDGNLTILHSFAGGASDGATSFGGLIQATDGNFYGTTAGGGGANGGTVFKMTSTGTLTVMHAFSGPDGLNPASALIQARDGHLYGTTTNGGASGRGVVFRLTLSGTLNVLHSFGGGTGDGAAPMGGVVQGADDNLYGLTSLGGATDQGVIFRTATSLNPNPLNTAPVLHDIDGDGETDLAVWRPSTGTWYVRNSMDGYNSANAFQWGLPGDIPVSGDFDGDGKVDLTVWRPSNGTWYIRYSSLGYSPVNVGIAQWGLLGDVPLSGDFDGDGRTDIVVWRPSNGSWYILYSSLGYSQASAGFFQWGLPGDVPLSTDFDGDRKADLTVWRPSDGTWYIAGSSSGFMAFQWGLPGDVPLSTDFDGDGKTDLAVWRPSNGTWYISYSSLGYSTVNGGAFQWGMLGDIPLSTDFDGDGKTDVVIYRPSEGSWFIRYSSLGYATDKAGYYQWGLAGDTVVR
jgi:uncharacterized repeat protein (TIGR03803 family)